MDVNALPVSPDDLYASFGTAKAPLLIDVRRCEAFDSGQLLIVGAARRLPDDVSKWRNALPAGRPIVAYCVHGHEVSQSVASTLRGAGITASYLEGGIAGWQERKLPTRRKRDASENKWVTFDAIVDAYGIKDPALDRLATIVRGADTSRPDLVPQCEGLLAISYGLSSNFPDDHEMLKHGMVMYDALYTWCRLETAKQKAR